MPRTPASPARRTAADKSRLPLVVAVPAVVDVDSDAATRIADAGEYERVSGRRAGA